jgi:creatinine amidohydrolase
VPPDIFFRSLLYQLRACYNAGFQTAILLSGHGGDHARDMKRMVRILMEYVDMNVWYGVDFDLLVGSPYRGDHAGKYEISALMHIRPDLVDPTLISLEQVPGSGGRLALHPTAGEASPAYGKEIMDYCIKALSRIVENRQAKDSGSPTWNRCPLMTYDQVEQIWERLKSEAWECLQISEGKEPVSPSSRWKPFERSRLH